MSQYCELLISNSKWNVLNPITLRKAKIVYNFGLSECNRVKIFEDKMIIMILCNFVFLEAVSIF